MADVEQLATLLSRSRWFRLIQKWRNVRNHLFVFIRCSKSVDQLKAQYPTMEESIKGVLSYHVDRQAEESR